MIQSSQSQNRVSVIILNWNGLAYLQRYLPSVVAHTDPAMADVIVADNGSTDGSVAWLKQAMPQVQVFEFAENHGFAEGYNIAVDRVDTEYVVLLNSDVEVTPGWLDAPIAYMEKHPRVAACQPKILQAADHGRFEFAGACGGFIDYLGYPFCRGRIMDTLETDSGQYDTVVPVFWATGACLIIRQDDYVDYGGLDPRFFAHQEEIDLCWRLWSRGREVVVVPQSKVFHVGGGTLNKENPRKTYLNFRNNLLMLYKNLPFGKLLWLMPVRFVLDWTAALSFLLQGHPHDFLAVVRARWSYHRMKAQMRASRRQNREVSLVDRIPTVYPHSILVQSMLLGRRQYSRLASGK
ncbi:MAG: glycosyltransferase family 2 protein [Paludibacteraceae bacterium]|nr:glycosyltransferase family 2 protein [Paludibacteraceae bacterium]